MTKGKVISLNQVDKGKKYTVGSMFAGVGGICSGFIKAGCEITWANEIDKYACMTYRENFGDKYLIEGDIHNIDNNNIPHFDILTSGFPCQAFSIAGHQKGFEDDRGNLFYETLRIIKNKKPRVFLLENVKNLVSHNKGQTLEVIYDELINSGYFIKHKVLNTKDYGNIPQNRERVYIVGFRDKKEYEKFSFPEQVPLKNNINNLIDKTVKQDNKYYYGEDSKYYNLLNSEMTNSDSIYQLRRVYVRENKSNVCPTLTANMGTGGNNVPLIRDNFGIRKLTPRECFDFQGFPKKFIIPDKVSNTQLYKQSGNSVTVSVIKRIAMQIVSTLSCFDEDMDKSSYRRVA